MIHLPKILACAIVAVSCSQVNGPDKEPLCDYAQQIIRDKNGAPYRMIASTAPMNSKGSIVIVGEKEQTVLLGNRIAGADVRNNVSAELLSDGILDFAGEQFFMLYDEEHSPYAGVYERESADSLRRLAVELCLDAIDTVCAVSPYDRQGEGRKLQAKLIVLNSAYLTSFGEYDASELFSQIGSSVRIISPLDCMIRKMLSTEKESYRVAVFAPEGANDKEIYQTSIRKACSEMGKTLSECYVFRCDTSDVSCLSGMLDSYIENGGAGAFDFIFCDDLTIDAGQIIRESGIINSVMYEESMKYGSYISRDVIVLDSARETTDALYSHLRQSNNFRFRIAQPQKIEFMTNDGWMIPFSERYLQ